MLDLHFYSPHSAHNWNPNIGLLGGPYSNDNNTPDFYERIQNLCVNSSFECLISKTFSRRLRIPYCSKVIVETMTEVHSSTHFESD